MAQHQLRASPQTVRIGVFDATFPPVMTIESGDRVVVQCVSGRDEVMPPASAGLTVPPELERDHRRQSGDARRPHRDRPDRHRRRRTRRHAGDPHREDRAGRRLGLQRDPPARRHAAGGFPRDGAQPHPGGSRARRVPAAVGHGTGAGAVLRRDGRGAAAGVRHHRIEGAAHPRRQHGQQGTGRPAARCICRCGYRAPISRSATATACRATARSASPRWRCA